MFSTGQFSKVARVSKRLLQYYDEIGLFLPSHTDPKTGSRSYDAEQLPKLFQILALKDLGISLEQIRGMVGSGLSNAEIHKILIDQKAQIRDRLEQEQLRLRAVESRLRSFEAAEGSLGDLFIKPMPELHALTHREVFPTMDDGIAVLVEVSQEAPKQLGRAAGQIVALNYCDGHELVDIEGEIGVLLDTRHDDSFTVPRGRVFEPCVLPAHGAMVCSVHQATPEDTNRSFAAIGLWLERTGHRIAGSSREVFLEPPSPSGQAVIETQLPIVPAQPRAARVAREPAGSKGAGYDASRPSSVGCRHPALASARSSPLTRKTPWS